MQSGAECQCNKLRHHDYDKYGRDRKSKKYYDSREWQQIRETVLEMDQRYDVYQYMTKGIVMIADTVHHIIPLKDDWNKRNDIDNLMSLNHDTHSMIEAMYRKNKDEMQETLKEMLTRYRELVQQGGV